ncbi:MAG: DUF192 domain-containing protein [Patescibacteria group bacterium]
MNRKSRLALFAVFVFVVGAISFNILNEDIPVATNLPDASLRTVQVAGQPIKVIVADTPEARAKGLGGQTRLAPDEGMLFVFDSDAKYQFWMKDMRFPIDILWLSDKGEVVDIRENASPATYPAVFAPNSPARYVLELPAGFAKENGVSIGEIVRL